MVHSSILGIHLHSMGVKRRIIDLLASLGVTISYTIECHYLLHISPHI